MKEYQGINYIPILAITLALGLSFINGYLWLNTQSNFAIEIQNIQNNINEIQNQIEKFKILPFHQRYKRQSDEKKKVANVEFIHPKLREETESREPEDPNNPWVWLTSYSRIPLEAIQDFCAATKEYCPPGKAGAPGQPGAPGVEGSKGKRGRPGRTGITGKTGPPGKDGTPGPIGPQGEIGKPGFQGLDGRNGLPGEPGLDGVPGRNGLDGVPGIDGVPGTPGIPGFDGKNGPKGQKGDPGMRGILGERGLPGPRGKAGKDGEPGKPGKPGISVWKVNNKEVDKLMIPPTISGSDDDDSKKIIVKEGDHLKLTCASTGLPKPLISWNRGDGNAFPDGSWRKSNEVGSTLNITKINRQHMGEYICEANNGIPPAAKQKFQVEVHFPPLIYVHRQVVGGYNGSYTSLECTIEAYPNAVNYWERHDGKIIQPIADKYKISLKEYDGYKSVLSINISLSQPVDFGAYYCISKNEKGLTKAAITLFERDPNSALPPPLIGGYRPTVIGEKPPPFASFDDICPPKPKCPTCEVQRCEGAAKMYGLTILPYDSSLPGLPNRTEECMVETVGKPVYHRYSTDLYGSWMIDAQDAEGEDGKKIWITKSDNTRFLYEFANKTLYRRDTPSRNYSLPFPFKGNDHIMYNGSFYYYCHEIESIIKFELNTRQSIKLPIPRNRITRDWQGSLLTKLYKPQQENNYFDFATDENGIWGLFGMAMDNNTVVMKMDPYTLDLQYVWNISLNHHHVADTFIICGVLYAVDHVDERNTRIRFALDLYKNKLLEIELPYTNPFSFTTMLNYNPKLQSLATWDSGNQLTYPIKYHSIGYKEETFEPETNSTGFILESEKTPGIDIQELLDLDDDNS